MATVGIKGLAAPCFTTREDSQSSLGRMRLTNQTQLPTWSSLEVT